MKVEQNYWIGVVSRAHVEIGVAGQFTQLNHGKKAPLRKFQPNDGLIMYSPRVSHPDGASLQAFTAIGRIVSAEIYQVTISEEFQPYRVAVNFFDSLEAPIRPLLDDLSFVTNKRYWGASFRFGQVQISAEDFALIAHAMNCPQVV